MEKSGIIIDKALRSAHDIGPMIRAIRRARSLTQADLSKITGIKQQTISAIENGVQQAEISTVFRILSSLNLELTVRPRDQRTRGYAPGRN